MSPAFRIASGSFVLARLDGMDTLCLKAERSGRDYTNHYLIILEPPADRDAMRLVYIDPDHDLSVIADKAFAFEPIAAEGPGVGDAFATPQGPHLKVMDEAKAQKHFAYVDMQNGLIRPRMERHAQTVLRWTVTSSLSA
ncbi:hypothetical protein CU669_04045 [Paramagnetospirillum kuznetsovii]|uniref:Uncharacterized protein n=1 Tax=Paramagnetospirillum kuznetsovii TaxID=2053833 RepID=A0A364P2D1_9PROT|nr:hypothetical protein [Paramagnetospirillum kuznetsovii]RAU23317.1 hypothetical protein CU669_04045 [Paramagnetospirillum kuznetsovii]